MVDMSTRCPRCGSGNREQRDYSSREAFYKNPMGGPKIYRVSTTTYCCSDCGLIYTQEQK